jgi:hypothetical protein
VNGVFTSGRHHRDAALAVAECFRCPVIGVYNKTDGGKDIVQCVTDKLRSPRGAVRARTVDTRRAFHDGLSDGATPYVPPRDERLRIVDGALAGNPATLALFHLLLLPATRGFPLFAHSQGNFIASAALEGVDVVDGHEAIAGRMVRSYGSPCWSWPTAIRPTQRNYDCTGDPISWLAPFTWLSFRNSTAHSAVRLDAHSFINYLRGSYAAELFANGHVVHFCVRPRCDEHEIARELLYWTGQGENAGLVRSVTGHVRDTDPKDASPVAAFYVDGQSDVTLRRLRDEDPSILTLFVDVLSYQNGTTKIESGRMSATPGAATPGWTTEPRPVPPLNRRCVARLQSL